MRRAAILAALVLLATPLRAEVETWAEDGRVRINARAAPLSEVLDDLARRTGMKVAYEGAPPHELVTATLERGTLVEALLAVFEGLDLTYVIELDATGKGVAKLVMLAGVPRVPTTSRAPLPGRRGGQARPAELPSQPEPEPGEPEADDGSVEVNDPGPVMRDRVATYPRSGESAPPDVVPETSPPMRFPQGMPTPQPPTPATP